MNQFLENLNADEQQTSFRSRKNELAKVQKRNLRECFYDAADVVVRVMRRIVPRSEFLDFTDKFLTAKELDYLLGKFMENISPETLASKMPSRMMRGEFTSYAARYGMHNILRVIHAACHQRVKSGLNHYD